MSKDPAVLWYFGDWLGGTATLTRHQKGCYMDLLSAQFNSGPLSLEEIKTVLGPDYSTAWGSLSKKFKSDPVSGLFFNERLEAERLKRKAFCESRRLARLSGINHKKDVSSDVSNDVRQTDVGRTENENENINAVEVKKGGAGGKRFVPPTIDEVTAYCRERQNHVQPEKFRNYYESNGWKVGKNPMKDWKAAIRTWESNVATKGSDAKPDKYAHLYE